MGLASFTRHNVSSTSTYMKSGSSMQSVSHAPLPGWRDLSQKSACRSKQKHGTSLFCLRDRPAGAETHSPLVLLRAVLVSSAISLHRAASADKRFFAKKTAFDVVLGFISPPCWLARLMFDNLAHDCGRLCPGCFHRACLATMKVEVTADGCRQRKAGWQSWAQLFGTINRASQHGWRG